ARTTGIEPAQITLHRAMLGGAFGRRSVQEMDFVVDAAWLSQQLNRPVKIIWSREDDVAWGWYKPMTAHVLRAAVDGNAKVLGWHHRTAVQEPLATAEPQFYEALDHRPLVSMRGAEHPVYDLPDRLVEHLPMEPGIRTYPLLGVGVTPNKFAVESFVDELAVVNDTDPLEFRIKLAKNSKRSQRVLAEIAKFSSWGQARKRSGHEVGLAFADYHGSILAGVAEISVEPDRGKISVHEFWVVIDPGIAIQPDNIKAQLEGAIIFGLGNALTERITFRNGVVQQSNFDDYVVPRISDIPRIHTSVLPSGNKPTAVGQTGAVLVAPAIANAFARLTGKRLRHMPFIPERVRGVLNS
ncbi:MAG: molybdopterin-dependent oxidoreductase, partial [Gammaproteobacteria bacterium]|nr:molybdopterin-dependent oxidoreductase [Gammaproteobacteria bacterium]